MPGNDYNDAAAVTREIFWVGFYDKEASLHCNPFLLVDGEEAVLLDPGSIPHFPIIMRKIIETVPVGRISHIVASHQDPDVCGNLPVVEDVIDRSDLKILTHSRTQRLIRHYGLTSEILAVDEMDYEIELRSGRVLEFIPTPYLHAPGAIATYDRATKSLFSSDLFGAVSKEWSLFADKGFPGSMALFHQEYMPGNAQLRACMEHLETYDIDRILPQHGSVIEGDQVAEALDFLKLLRCGNDLEEEKT